LQLGQAGLNLANSSYVELLQREKAARDLKLEIGRQIDFTSGTLIPRERMVLKQNLTRTATLALLAAKKFRQNELIPQVFKLKGIDVLNNHIANNAELRAGGLDPEKATIKGQDIDLIGSVNVKISDLEQALSEGLADEDLQLVIQKIKELRANLVILEKVKRLFRQLKEFENSDENTRASTAVEEVSKLKDHFDQQQGFNPTQLSSFQQNKAELSGLRPRIEEEISLMDDESKVISEARGLLAEIDRALQQILEIDQHIETAQLTRFEKRVRQLNDAINSILAIDLNTAKGNSNLTARFEHQQAELKRQVGFATRVNLLIGATEAGCENNQKVEARIKEIVAKIEEAKEHIARAIEATKERSETEVSKEALKKEYAEIREELLFQLWRIEEVEPSGTHLAESWANISELHLRPLKKIAEQLEALNLTGYIEDADNVEKEIGVSNALFFQFGTFKSATLAKVRTPLPGASLILGKNAPLKPEHVAWLMMNGLNNPDFGDVSNLKFESEPVQMISLKRDNDSKLKFEKKDIRPTVVTKLMREIDRVYFSDGDLDGDLKIEVAKIHESYETLIEHLQHLAEDLGIPEDKNQSLRVATRVFRLHWLFTFHQSYLIPESSPSVSDNFFYMYRWHRYFLKYVGTQIGQWLNEITDRTFGMAGLDYYREKDRRKVEDELRFTETNQYADSELLARLGSKLSPRQVGSIPLLYYDRELEREEKRQKRQKRKKKGGHKSQEDLRKKKKGFANYSWIFRPLHQLKSRMYRSLLPLPSGPDPRPGSQEAIKRSKEEGLIRAARRDEGYTIATPLQYWLLRKVNDRGEAELDEKGNQKVVRFEAKRGDKIGEVATFDSALRTDRDEYIYEEIAKQLKYFQPGELLSYFQDLESGPFQVLSNIWKAKIEDVVGVALAPKGLNGLKKLYHFAVPFLPNIGPEIRSGSSDGKELSKAAENEATLIIAIAVLNYKIQQDFWGKSKIIKQLDRWRFEDQIIDAEDWKFLLAVTYKTRSLAILARAAGEGIRDQLEKKLAVE